MSLKLDSNDTRKVDEQDLPALHGAASGASLKAQKRYLGLFVLNLLLLIFGRCFL